MYSIGEFSRITGLTVKTLRFYHEKGLLLPQCVDAESNYRYYAAHQMELARVITSLRSMEFSLEQIAEILASLQHDDDILAHLEKHRQRIDQKQKQYREIAQSLDAILLHERNARMALQQTQFEPELKTLEPMLMAGFRMQGKYSDCGKGFSKLGRALGRYISGTAFLLHYDSEYKENDADFEACFPVRQGKASEGIAVRELPGGRFACLMHQGPYEELGRSYALLLDYVKKHQLQTSLPSREVYHKGPGMIFKGNPKKYLTEIQMPVA